VTTDGADVKVGERFLLPLLDVLGGLEKYLLLLLL
jgi:hypothetical protein